VLTFTEFINQDARCREINDKRENWNHDFQDWEKSLKEAFAVLIYCAKHNKKITYAALGRACNVPEVYTRGRSTGIIIGKMLECIGRYCRYELPGTPHLTALCVNTTTGFPGEGYWELFNKIHAGASLTTKKDILLKKFNDLHDYDWTSVEKQLNIKPDVIKFSSDLRNQDKFYIPKNMR